MNHLTRHDYAEALQLLGRIEALADDVDAFARAATAALNSYLACEHTRLWICDLRQEVVVSAGQEMAFIACHADPDHCIGLAHTIAVLLHREADSLVSLVLRRSKLPFDERDRERLELLRPHLAFLYSHACRVASSPLAGALAQPQARMLPESMPRNGLTLRECDVLQWLACGKTDAEIAGLLSISPRTVHKHLEHIYVKLGVETRTAAVMRVLSGRQAGTVAVQAFTRG